MATARLTGLPASPGLALGPILVLGVERAERAASGDPAREAAALRSAIANAGGALAALAEKSGGEAGAMLGFQVAMLEDGALSEDAFSAITEGVPAERAWRAALDAEVAGYRAADDEYFRARAGDLVDIRDRVLDLLTGAAAKTIPEGAIVFAEDLAPSLFLTAHAQVGGIVLSHGSPTSHVAMLARTHRVPMVVGVDRSLDAVEGKAGDAMVDGGAGSVLLAPDAADRETFARVRSSAAAAAVAAAAMAARPAVTADGTPIAVQVNIASLAELDRIDPAICDGVGLVRTELLIDAGDWANEDAQALAYARVGAWAAGRPVTIRTLDAGGDKPIPGVTVDGESNPFLGVRGIRLTLRRPELFRIQLRALARAAAEAPIEIMLPMVTVPAELEAARELLEAAVAELARESIPHRRPPLGIMIEVPAAALAIEAFDADFFSIGSNDLAQYVAAAGRDNAAVAALADVAGPGVLRLIAEVCAHGARTGRKVSLCGDAGGDPRLLPQLLAQGLRVVSVAPSQVAAVKAAIANVRLAEPVPA